MAHSKAHQFDDDHDYKQMINTYAKAFTYPARVDVLRWLAEEGPKHPTEISTYIGLSMSTTSHHLAMMERAGLIQGFEDGRHILYQFNELNFPVMRGFFTLLFDQLEESIHRRAANTKGKEGSGENETKSG